MIIIPLNAQERAQSGFSHKIVSVASDWTDKTSGTAYSILPALGTAASPTGSVTLPAGTIITKCAVNVTTAATHASTVVMTIGDGGSAARFFPSTTVKTTGSTPGTTTAVPYVYPAADTIDATLTVGAGALSTLTTLVMEIYFSIADNSLQLQQS